MVRRPKEITPELEAWVHEIAEAAAEKAAKRAAHRAVRDMLVVLGVNAETDGAKIEMQADHEFLRRLRFFSQSTQSKILLSTLGAVLAVIGGFLAMSLHNIFPGVFPIPK